MKTHMQYTDFSAVKIEKFTRKKMIFLLIIFLLGTGIMGAGYNHLAEAVLTGTRGLCFGQK